MSRRERILWRCAYAGLGLMVVGYGMQVVATVGRILGGP